ncbi:MAG: Ig-like domain-containing protein, partial [Kiritimatiellae bacterium]|nr:Ig-like domain-containing protein [Kiritimatiellia bacterium]
GLCSLGLYVLVAPFLIPENVRAAGPILHPIAPRLLISEPQSLPRSRPAHQRHPAVAFGANVYMMVWHEGFEGMNGNSDIFALRIGKDGLPLDKKPIPVCSTSGVQDSPVVAFCREKFLVAWADFRSEVDYDIYAAVVTPSGEVQPRDGFPVAKGTGTQAHPSITSNDKDEFFMVWQEFIGDHFEIRGAQLSAIEPASNPRTFAVMSRGERPVAAWTGSTYGVCQKWYATTVTPDGRNGVPTFQIWKSKAVAWPTAASAWNKCFFFFNTEPYPDPWGWGGNGTIIGVTMTATGESPELATAAEFGDLQAAEADGRIKNCLDAARWRNHPGWPMGMRGGLKGTQDGMWPNGMVAATYNGRSLVCTWPRAHMVDNRRLANRDLYITRVLPDWGFVDRPPVRIVAGPTEETNPVLAAGPEGQALLAYEKVGATGVEVEFRMLLEDEDTTPPTVSHVIPRSENEWIVAFDEPVDTESASQAANFRIEEVELKAAAFNTDNRGWQRETLLTTVTPLVRGKTYVMRINGICDRSPRRNTVKDAVVKFVAKPGSMLRGNFIDRWLVLGPFPRDTKNHPFDVATTRPTEGSKVGSREWITVKGAVLDFGARYGENGDQMVYVAVWSFSDRPREARLWIDSNDHNRVWWNGQAVHDGISQATASRGFHDYRDEIGIVLREGWNLLLIQIENRSGAWLMTAQLVDEKGEALRDLTWDVALPSEESCITKPVE